MAKAKILYDNYDKKQPIIFYNGIYAYKDLLAVKGLDVVLICTPWGWHTPISIDAMEAGVAVGCEVAGAMSVEERWQLVRTYERTKTPFVLMENVCYRRDVIGYTHMVRKDYFGELIHLKGGYEHDLRKVKFNRWYQLLYWWSQLW